MRVRQVLALSGQGRWCSCHRTNRPRLALIQTFVEGCRMQVLLIHCHPRMDSFSAALCDTAVAALRSAGHSVEVRDLYDEGFAPAAARMFRQTVADMRDRAVSVVMVADTKERKTRRYGDAGRDRPRRAGQPRSRRRALEQNRSASEGSKRRDLGTTLAFMSFDATKRKTRCGPLCRFTSTVG